MPTVRLSGFIPDNAPASKRESRAFLLYLLFKRGWDIYNSNGDQTISLANIEEKIVESDAFGFMPEPHLEDLFKVTSIFVGYQTLDKNLDGKPTALLNGDGSWDRYFSMLEHLQRRGTIRQESRDFLKLVSTPMGLCDELDHLLGADLPDAGRKVVAEEENESYEKECPAEHPHNVCVFCSASIEDQEFLDEGYELGKRLAKSGFGCVSGAGKTGIMGAVVGGASEFGGWTGGSNVPHIIALEGLPEGLTCFWPRPDIYERMEVMIERSDAFVAMPGGAGTVQEVLALLILKQQGHPVMKGKPVVVFNRKDAKHGISFWDPLMDILCDQGVIDLVESVDNLDDVMERVKPRG